MSARNFSYAHFDTNRLGTFLVAERSATVLSHNASCDTARNGLGLYGKSIGIWFVEFIIFPLVVDGLAATIGAGDVSIGIGNEDITDTECVGDTANSYGYRSDGALRTNNANVVTLLSGAAVGDVIGMVVDLDNARVDWYQNGVPLGRINLTGVHVWRIAVTASNSTTAFGTKVLMNAGHAAFAYPPASITNPGWYDSAESFGPLWLSDRPTLQTDGTRYRGLISAQQSSLTVTRQISFWPWSDSSAQGRSSLRVDNATGYVDNLFTGDARDSEVTLLDADTGEALAVMLVDSAQALDDGSAQVQLRDKMAETQVALQRRLMPPQVDPASAGKPWPLVLGAVYSIEPPIFDSASQTYAVNDGPLGAVGAVRDKGDQFDFLAGDYTIGSNGTITLHNGQAQGRITLDMSSVGGSNNPALDVDLLVGAGAFDSASGWTLGGLGAAASSIAGGKLTLADQPAGPTQLQSHDIVSWCKYNTLFMQAGRSYRIVIKATHVATAPNFGHPEWDVPAQLVVCGDNAGSTAPAGNHFAWIAVLAQPFGGQLADGAAEVEFVGYASPQVNDTYLWLALYGSSSTGDKAIITDIKVYEIGLDVIDDDSLEPITLEAFMREVLETRAGWAPEQWSAADAAAIDIDTGYRGVGLYAAIDSNMQIDDALNLAAQAYCASLWIDADGVLRITRLIAPESIAVGARAGSISITDMLDDPSVVIDVATNLSTRLGARKNWSTLVGGDLVTAGWDAPENITGPIEFADDGLTWSFKSPEITDFNTAVDPGFYSSASTTTHAPESAALGVLVLRSGGATPLPIQLAWRTGLGLDYYWRRARNNIGIWSAWSRMLALDAPADGKMYVRKDSTWVEATFLKLTGGTLTGTLTGTTIQAATIKDTGSG